MSILRSRHLQILFLLCFIMFGGCAYALNLTFEDGGRSRSSCYMNKVEVSGNVESGDAVKFKKFLDNAVSLRAQSHQCPAKSFIFEFNSMGGSVTEAILIGRLIRSHYGSLTVAYNCASACVFMHVGGVVRHVMNFRKADRGIGLHRFYFGDLPDKSAADVRAARDRLRREIHEFLVEMDVSTRILDISESVEPADMKWVTRAEAKDLRLNGIDATYDEIAVSKEAKSVGLTSAEYRSRKALGAERCNFDPSNPMGFWDCEESFILRRSMDEVKRLKDGIYKRCQAAFGPYPKDKIKQDKWEVQYFECIEIIGIKAN